MGKREPKICLFVACHKPSVVAENKLLYPIQVGAELAEKELDNMLHDNTGNNISHRNRQYAELTAQYWAWKNMDADYYGLFHYRRYFSFNPIELSKEVWIDEKGLSVFDKMYETINDDALQEINFQEEIMKSFISKYDVIAPIPDKMESSVYQHYKNAPYHRVEDLDEAVKVITEIYPEFIDSMKEYLNSKESYFCNMFIMKKEYFHEYCKWLFTILSEIEKRRDYSSYSIAEDRALAFLAERLFGVYFLYCKSKSNIKTTELQRVLFKNTAPLEKISKIEKANSVPLVLACDNNYIKYATVVIMSALVNTSPKNYLDVIIFERQISDFSKKTVQKTFKGYQNISVRFVHVQNVMDMDMDRSFPPQYPAEAAYRLIASELLSEYDKFVYLDCDTLVVGDIKKLYDIDLAGYCFGMAKDIDYIGHHCSDSEWRKYSENILGLKNPLNYFQSGVMLFNASLVRKQFSAADLCKMIIEKGYRFVDQDLLNVAGEGKIKNIGLEWNFLAEYQEGDFSRKKNIISNAPKELYSEYLMAEKSPEIIHFCIPVHLRPWNNPGINYGVEYWEILKKTYFYECALADLVRGQKRNISAAVPQMPVPAPMSVTDPGGQIVQVVDGNGIRIQGMDEVVYVRGSYIKLMKKLNRLFPMGSRKRSFIKKITGRILK